MPNDRTWSPCARTPPPTAGPDTPSGWPLPCSVTSTSELTTPTLSIHTDARNAAGQTGDRAAEAYALANLGVVHMRQGRYERAAEHYRRALRLFRETGDRGGEARTLTHLGLVNWRQGRYEKAAERHLQALTRYRETGNPVGEANALSNLNLVRWRQGRYEEAADGHRQALILYRETGRRGGEANALANLGVVYLRQSRYEQAAGVLAQALILFRETGNRIGEGYALANLGVVYLRQSRYEQAADDLRQAVAIFHETGNRDGEAEALNRVGETLHATGQSEQARAQHAGALTLAVETGDRYQQACAHTGLAHTHHAAGEHGLARLHWQPAPPPPGVTGGPVCYGPNVVAAATLQASTDVIGVERAADLMGALLKAPVSTGFVSRCLVRLDAALTAAGFEDALKDALRAADVLGTDETPAPLTTAATSAEGCGNPHVYTARTMRAYTGGGPDLIWYGRGGRPDQGAGHRVRDPGRLPRGPGPRRLRGYLSYDTGLAGVQQCLAHL